jgi:hypothetical protein
VLLKIFGEKKKYKLLIKELIKVIEEEDEDLLVSAFKLERK